MYFNVGVFDNLCDVCCDSVVIVMDVDSEYCGVVVIV